jgi:hypothetical protein
MFCFEVNDGDLAIAENASRSTATPLAAEEPTLRDGFERGANHCERIAERIAVSGSSPHFWTVAAARPNTHFG